MIGAGGLVGTITLADINATVAILVGLATLVYMIFRGAREIRKWKDGE